MDKRLVWIGGLAAAGAGALGLLMFTAKKASAATTSKLLQIPLKPGNLPDQTLAGGGVLDVIAPPGAALNGGNASPTVFAPSAPPDAQTYRWAAFAKGKGAVNVAWRDAQGGAQNTFFYVTVS